MYIKAIHKNSGIERKFGVVAWSHIKGRKNCMWVEEGTIADIEDVSGVEEIQPAPDGKVIIVNPMTMSELRTELKNMGITYPRDAKKKDLKKLYDDNQKQEE